VFVLIPVGHQEGSLRRVPWVTAAIATVCILVQLRSCQIEPKIMAEAEGISAEIAQLQERIANRGSPAAALLRQAGYHEFADEVDSGHPGEREALDSDAAELQARVDVLKGQLDALVETLPTTRLGFRPDRDGVVAMLTSTFAHAGWIHLLGNLLFLYLVGCNMEDRWGRVMFGAFYVVGGLVAATAFKLSQPTSSIPLVGASGAVAAAMGAFAACYGSATIRFVYAYWILLRPYWGKFQAPAWAALLMWFAQQVLLGWLDEGNGDGVAYAAHVGGFGFGLAVAVVLRVTGFDRALDNAVDAKVAVEEEVTERGENPHVSGLLRALELAQADPIREHAGDAFQHWSRVGAAELVTSTYRRVREQHWELELGEPVLRAVVIAAARVGTDPLVCVDVASQLIRQHPHSPLVPRAMWIAAQAQEALHRRDLCERTLNNLVLAYPMDPLTQQARRKLGQNSLRPPATS